MATLLRADGHIAEIAPTGQVFTLGELQALVGGYIEVIAFPDGRTAYLNEDGKGLQLPVNHEATARVRHWLTPGDVIVGDIVLCTRAETESDDDGE